MNFPQLSIRLFSSLSLAFVVGACSAAPAGPARNNAQTPQEAAAYPQADTRLGEKLVPGESAVAEKIAVRIEQSIRQQYRPGTARRDAHPKAHGCVKAEIRILEAIPASLVHGMFVPGRSYPAVIRFSNGSGDATRADIQRDARGMAIKVYGIPGEKLVEDGGQAGTQDFIMINHPVFFANDPGRYLELIDAQDSDSFFKKLSLPFALGVRGSLIALQTASSRIANPLQVRYWSMVPYQLGTGEDRVAVKYSARPCTAEQDPMPRQPAHDFLRDALRNTLQKRDACMELLVQPRTSASMSVEDSMTEWNEDKAPFYSVAMIHIPLQDFDSPDRNAQCENLAFNPWHALPAHKPLGAMNRMRKVIYERISRVRHEMNAP
jgi:hypothetical protein